MSYDLIGRESFQFMEYARMSVGNLRIGEIDPYSRVPVALHNMRRLLF